MHHIELIFVKAWAEIRSEVSRAYIGFIWWFLEPLLYMGAFYVLFGIGLRQGGDNFLFFLLCGLVPWKWFSSTLNSGSRSIVANAGLINQVYLPKYVFPLIVVVINTFKFTLVFPVLLLILILSGFELSNTWWSLLPVLAIQLMMVASCTCLLSCLVPYLPDLRYVIDNGMLLLMFLSGVFFSIDAMAPEIRSILLLNPIALLLECYREILLEGSMPNLNDLAYVIFISFLTGISAVFLLKRIDRKVIKEL